MLKHLTIKNYALIKTLSIKPSDNLNIITGETGAGKSIMLGAVGLLLGNRADTKALLDPESKCFIEGHFAIGNYKLEKFFEREDLDYDEVTILRREISPAGKSRAFVNDIPVTLDVLKRLGIKLMDVHSQHETLQLGKNTFQLKFVDVFAGTLDLRSSYFKQYQFYKAFERQLETLKAENEASKKEADYNAFLLNELVEAKLEHDEQESLESTVEVMENVEEIKSRLNQALNLVNGEEFSISNGLQELRTLCNQLAKYSNSYQNLADRIESLAIEVTDVGTELETEEEKVNFDPQEAQLAKDRLSLVYQLQQKHQVATIEDLLIKQQELEEKVNRAQNLDDEIKKVQLEVEKAETACIKLANDLKSKRKACFQPLSQELTELLAQLGMPDATVELTQSDTELEATGTDLITLKFSANKGIAPDELSKVASGGEFSRLMFCIKFILASKVALPTIIFDEIDTGISGEIALKMAAMMKRMAQNHQVITISHLPQIAGSGDQHYFVYKDNSSDKSISKIKKLEEDERILEIAKMLGGDNPSQNAFENARELMQ